MSPNIRTCKRPNPIWFILVPALVLRRRPGVLRTWVLQSLWSWDFLKMGIWRTRREDRPPGVEFFHVDLVMDGWYMIWMNYRWMIWIMILIDIWYLYILNMRWMMMDYSIDQYRWILGYYCDDSVYIFDDIPWISVVWWYAMDSLIPLLMFSSFTHRARWKKTTGSLLPCPKDHSLLMFRPKLRRWR